MATYAIGDIQGCHAPLLRLLDAIGFDPAADSLWFAGDLVNRGPDSLAVLRLVRALGAAAVSILGNHDLTLLAAAAGHVKIRNKDTFQSILEAPERDELLDWLRHRPLLHHDPALGRIMVHAGLPPAWDLARARACAAEVEAALRGPDPDAFLSQMFGSEPRRWSEGLEGVERLRYTVNALTRMRYVDGDWALNFDQKGPPGTQPPELVPWFAVPGRRNADLEIVCGHWASLGYYHTPGVLALDSACVWGGRLTAQRLDAPAEPVWVDCEGGAA